MCASLADKICSVSIAGTHSAVIVAIMMLIVAITIMIPTNKHFIGEQWTSYRTLSMKHPSISNNESFYLHYIIQCLKYRCNGYTIIPIFRWGKWDPREVASHVQGHQVIGGGARAWAPACESQKPALATLYQLPLCLGMKHREHWGTLLSPKGERDSR